MKVQSLIIAGALSLSSLSFAATERFNLDTKESKVEWTGSKVVGGKHHGEVSAKSGFLQVKDGQPAEANVVIDMTSLKNSDLTEADKNKKLVDHLKSDDFFSVDKFPVAELTIKTIHKDKKNSKNTYTWSGEIQIKGIKKPLSGPATLVEDTAKKKVLTSELEVDRTEFDVRYGSGKFFENLGDKVISDKFTLKTKMVFIK